MNLKIVFALAITITCGFNLRSSEAKTHGLEFPKIEPEGRIINGQKAAVGQFKYQAGIYVIRRTLVDAWCGGSLISNEWILTAAHCLSSTSTAIVYLGDITHMSGEVIYNVTRADFIIHPGWSRIPRMNDIALIKIPRTEYSANIQPVKLPPITKSCLIYVNEKVIVSGWGSVLDTGYLLSDYLQWARMDAISNADCSKRYLNRSVRNTNICTALTDCVGPKMGDSGGPLVLEATQVQIGIVSFGSHSSCRQGVPEVYTRVATYLRWIKSHTGIYY